MISGVCIPSAAVVLVTAFGHRQLAGDRGEDKLDLIAEPEEDGNGDDGNKSQNQGVLDEGLAFSGSRLPTGLFLRIHEIAPVLL
jgi:hypothetical protein